MMQLKTVPRWMAALIALMSGAAEGVNQPSQEFVLLSSRDGDGPEIEWVIDEAMLCSSSVPWSPESDAPPLSITRAVQSAMDAPKAKGRWVVTSVSMHAALRCGQHLAWYYRIEMYDEAATFGDTPPDTGTRVVLMDGRLVSPRRKR